MKTPLSLKSSLFAVLLIFSSCATTKYSDKVEENSFVNLQTGRTYVFKLKNNAKQKMVFSRITDSEVIGFANKRDSTMVTLSKSDIVESKDSRKSTIATTATVIGAAAAGALVISVLRDSEE